MSSLNKLYDLEMAYLSEQGKEILAHLQEVGLHRDLALELMHQLIPHEDLYDLDHE